LQLAKNQQPRTKNRKPRAKSEERRAKSEEHSTPKPENETHRNSKILTSHPDPGGFFIERNIAAMLVTRNVVTKEEVIAAVKELAGKLRRPPRYAEVIRVVNVTRRQVQRMFGGWAAVLEESGCERIRLGGGELTLHELWHDWVAVARKAERMPTIRQYEKFSRYSVRPLKDRFGAWERVPAAMLGYGDSKGLWGGWEDVRELVGGRVEECPGGQMSTQKSTREAWRHGESQSQEFLAPGLKPLSLDHRYAALKGRSSTQKPQQESSLVEGLSSTQNTHQRGVLLNGRSSSQSLQQTSILVENRSSKQNTQSRRFLATPLPEGIDESLLYGEPFSLEPMATAPTNEAGVMFLFATLARELGYVVIKVQKAFPDCEAFRRLENGSWQRVRIEFEFTSRNFVLHGHDVKGCELLVCWENDWQECPLEVIELRKIFERSGDPAIG